MTFKLDHINLTVSDLEKSIQWYQNIFDMDVVEKGFSAENKPWAIVARNDSMICMTEYAERGASIDWQQKTSHEFQHIYHFGFRTPDKEIWEAKIKKYDLQLYYGGINEYPHSLSWYVKDPSGHTIEVSYTKDKMLKFSSERT